MANFEGNSLDDPRAFERFLRDKGFSRARAKAITAKGFGGTSCDQDELSSLVDILDKKRADLECKGFREEFQLLAPPMPLRRWSPWYRLKAVTSHPRLKSSFELKFTSLADLSGPYFIQVDYAGPNGRSNKEYLSPGTLKLPLPLNSIQEPKVRARSGTVNGQLIRVLKYGS